MGIGHSIVTDGSGAMMWLDSQGQGMRREVRDLLPRVIYTDPSRLLSRPLKNVGLDTSTQIEVATL